MLTAQISLRSTFLSVDFEPSVATSLGEVVRGVFWRSEVRFTYQTVATPCLREVRTMRNRVREVMEVEDGWLTLVAIEHD
jgi:hypothetical protein